MAERSFIRLLKTYPSNFSKHLQPAAGRKKVEQIRHRQIISVATGRNASAYQRTIKDLRIGEGIERIAVKGLSS
jgi:hypothetical protein